MIFSVTKTHYIFHYNFLCSFVLLIKRASGLIVVHRTERISSGDYRMLYFYKSYK